MKIFFRGMDNSAEELLGENVISCALVLVKNRGAVKLIGKRENEKESTPVNDFCTFSIKIKTRFYHRQSKEK